MKKLFIFILIVLSAGFASAQDEIHTIAGSVIKCKVVDVGTEEVKYRLGIDREEPTISIRCIDIHKIIFANGHTLNFRDGLENPDLYKNDKKNVLKVDFLSPLFNSTSFSYERSFRPGFSLEGTIGIIGAGTAWDETKPRGALVKFGPRFMRTPDYKNGSLRYAHILKGAYIQPQLILGLYNWEHERYTADPFIVKKQTSYLNLMLVFGKQSVFANVFAVDYYCGIGYGFVEDKTLNDPGNNGTFEYYIYEPKTFGVLTSAADLPVAITAGIKLGYLFK